MNPIGSNSTRIKRKSRNLESGSETVGELRNRRRIEFRDISSNDEGISHHRGAAAPLCLAAPAASSRHSAPTSWERAAAIFRLGKRWCASRSSTLALRRQNKSSLVVEACERHRETRLAASSTPLDSCIRVTEVPPPKSLLRLPRTLRWDRARKVDDGQGGGCVRCVAGHGACDSRGAGVRPLTLKSAPPAGFVRYRLTPLQQHVKGREPGDS